VCKVFACGALMTFLACGFACGFETDGAYRAVVDGVVRHPGPLSVHGDEQRVDDHDHFVKKGCLNKGIYMRCSLQNAVQTLWGPDVLLQDGKACPPPQLSSKWVSPLGTYMGTLLQHTVPHTVYLDKVVEYGERPTQT